MDSLVSPQILCQQALARVLTYIADDGVEMNVASCSQALRLVDSALAEGADLQLPARCVSAIPHYFDRPALSFPVCSPPLKRGCIGYD